MAIPASGAISMSMLATEFSASQTTNVSLRGLASELSTPVTSNIFEAASFYGQSAFSGTSFTNIEDGSGANPFASGELACEGIEEGTSATRFHNGAGTYPANGDKVLKTNNLSDPIGNGFFSFNAGRSNFSYQVSGGDGTVSNKTGC
jgi:hypothetical protein